MTNSYVDPEVNQFVGLVKNVDEIDESQDYVKYSDDIHDDRLMEVDEIYNSKSDVPNDTIEDTVETSIDDNNNEDDDISVAAESVEKKNEQEKEVELDEYKHKKSKETSKDKKRSSKNIEKVNSEVIEQEKAIKGIV